MLLPAYKVKLLFKNKIKHFVLLSFLLFQLSYSTKGSTLVPLKVEKPTIFVTPEIIKKKKKELENVFEQQPDYLKNFLISIEKKKRKAFTRLLKKVDLNQVYLVKIKTNPAKGTYRIVPMRILPFIALHGWYYAFRLALEKVEKKSKHFTINAQDEDAMTLLMHVSRYGHLGLVKYLVNKKNTKKSIDFFLGAADNHEYPYQKTALGKAFRVLRYSEKERQIFGIIGQEHAKIVNFLAQKMLEKVIDNKDVKALKRLIINNALIKPLEVKFREAVYWKITFTSLEITPAAWVTIGGWLEGLKSLLVDIRDVNQSQDNIRRTLLMLASGTGNLPIVKYLVEKKKASIIQKNQNGWTAMTYASRFGYEDIVEYLIQQAYKRHKKDYDDNWNEALFCGVFYDYPKVVKVLLHYKKKGIIKKLSMHIANFSLLQNKRTALIQAIDFGYAKIVEILLCALQDSLKEDREIKYDNDGRTPIIYAYDDEKILRYLIDLEENSVPTEVKKLFIQDINQRDGKGWTAIMYSAYYGAEDVIPIFIKAGADINKKNKLLQTPIMVASQKGKIVFLKRMYSVVNEWNESKKQKNEKGVIHIDIDAKSSTGETAVIYAGKENKPKVVQFLTEQGASLLISDDDDRTVFLHVCQLGYAKILDYLLEITKQASSNELLGEGQNNNKKSDEKTTTAFKEKFIYGVDKNKRTGIMLAISGGHQAIMERLIDYEKEDSANQANEHILTWHKKDDKAWTIVNWAANYGEAAMLEFMLNPKLGLDLDINNKGIKGKTPLILGATNGHIKAVKVLVEAGASLREEDDDNHEALYYALKGTTEKHQEVARYLFAVIKKRQREQPSLKNNKVFFKNNLIIKNKNNAKEVSTEEKPLISKTYNKGSYALKTNEMKKLNNNVSEKGEEMYADLSAADNNKLVKLKISKRSLGEKNNQLYGGIIWLILIGMILSTTNDNFSQEKNQEKK